MRQLSALEVGGDDVVLPAGEEHRRTGVALASGAAAQLVVQPLGVVPAGADDVQAAEFGHLLSWSASSEPPSRMSVPRPAIWVETVTAPSLPASAMTAASSSSFFAFSTTAGTPRLTSRSCSSSDSATSWVPTSTG